MKKVSSILTLVTAVAACSSPSPSTSLTGQLGVRTQAGVVTPSVTLVADTTTPAAGASVNYKVTAPELADVSRSTQTLSASWDAARQSLSGMPTLPEGWNVEFFMGSTSVGNTPSNWAGVDRVVTTGPEDFTGRDGVLQSTGELPGSSFTGSTGGDGFGVTFDERGYVYNIHHHATSSTTAKMDCHTRDGARCPGQWPFTIFSLMGQMRNFAHFDAETSRVYFPTGTWTGSENTGNASEAGFGCVDVANPAQPRFCGGSIQQGGFVNLEASSAQTPRTYYDPTSGMAVVGRRLFTFRSTTQKLLCLDMTTGQACAGLNGASYPEGGRDLGLVMPSKNADGFSPANPNELTSYLFDLAAHGNNVYLVTGAEITCLDASTDGPCAGFDAGGGAFRKIATTSNKPVLVPNAAGSVEMLCLMGYQFQCYTLDGQPTNAPSTLATVMSSTTVWRGGNVAPSSTSGTKVVWVYSLLPVMPGGYTSHNQIYKGVMCWDAASADGSCQRTVGSGTGFPVNLPYGSNGYIYFAAFDPTNENCLWMNGDWGNNTGAIKTFDVAKGQDVCQTQGASGKRSARFDVASVIPRMACNPAERVAGWKSFKLAHPPVTGYASATVTVRDSVGQTVSGWDKVALPNDQALDLSALTVTQTGQAAAFIVEFEGLTSTGTPKADFEITGARPELCFGTQLPAVCPSTAGLLGALSAPAATNVSAEGSVTPVGGAVSAFGAASEVINQATATQQQCGASLGGTVRFSSGAAVSGVVVTLLDDQGQVILDGSGAPVTAASDASGNLVFPALSPGDYRVRLESVSPHFASSIAVGPGFPTTVNTPTAGQFIDSVIFNLSAAGTATIDAVVAEADADNDGIPDRIEQGSGQTATDTDNDGVPDYLDYDTDNDGIPDAVEAGASGSPIDTDSDGLPDYVDLDTDGDGRFDASEAGYSPVDINPDGTLKGAVGANGLADFLETSTDSGTVAYTLRDTDGNLTPDFRQVNPPDVELTSDKTSVTAGDLIHYKLKATAGDDVPRSTQTLTSSWDAARQSLTGMPTLPEGWSVEFFKGNTSVGSSPSSWAGVDRVVATGSKDFTDREGVAQTSGTLPGSSFGSSSGGDGYGVTFDERGYVYNIYHHANTPSTAKLECHTRSGAVCPGGWPFSIYPLMGLHRNFSHVDVATGRLYFGTAPWTGTQSTGTASGAGFGCVDVSDISNPTWCGGSIANGGFIDLDTAATSTAWYGDATSAMAVVGSRIFAFATASRKLLCLDTTTGQACAGLNGASYPNGGRDLGLIPPTLNVEGFTTPIGMVKDLFDMQVHGTNIYLSTGAELTCLDASTDGPCAGFDAGGGTFRKVESTSSKPALIPDASGTIIKLCLIGYPTDCFTLDGTPTSVPATLSSLLAVTPTLRAGSQSAPSTSGSKVVWVYATAPVGPAGYSRGEDTIKGVMCWDAASQDGRCMRSDGTSSGFPYVAPYAFNGYTYFAAFDPTNENCVWINGDNGSNVGAIKTFDVVKGQAVCQTPGTAGKPSARFDVANVIPRMACDPVQRVGGWKRFKLAYPPVTGYASATVTVRDSAGQTVSGWDKVALPNDQTLDLSALSVTQTGQAGSFLVEFTGLTASGNARADFEVTGALPEMCFETAMARACQASGWQSLAAPADTIVDGTGMIQPLGGTPQSLGRDVVSISQVTPSLAQCVGGLSGTVRSSTGARVAGITLTLLDSSGLVVRDGNGDPISVLSDSAGLFSFPSMIDGNYRLRLEPTSAYVPESISVNDGDANTPDQAAAPTVSATPLDSNTFRVRAEEDAIVEAVVQSGDSDHDGILDRDERASNGDPVDTDADGVPDYLDLDSDNDGLPDEVERGTQEFATPVDTDGDALPDFRDLDADADGIVDALEAGYSPVDIHGDGTLKGTVGTNGLADFAETAPDSGLINYVVRNTDSDSNADFRDVDSDGDGIRDSVEKGVGGLPVDSDGDSTPDYLDTDSDKDGISDRVETDQAGTLTDTDGDLTPDYLDTDTDNDGLSDTLETDVDLDGDQVGNWRDLDSDGDTLIDASEGATDTDGDGKPNALDGDSDGDGIPDAVEKGTGGTPADSDGDQAPDHLDLDSDNDGIPDAVERGADGQNPRDTDGDGTPDFRDLDSDDDGIPDEVERGADGQNPRDSDSDGPPDHRDLDSDNDGIPDAVERGPNGNGNAPRDSDGDGLPDYRDLDSDGDTIADSDETHLVGNLVDTDSDNTPDYLDLDSDNDGIDDRIETAADFDEDGQGNWRDLDSDGDALSDSFEKGPGSTPVDSDGDGARDYLDLDSDNDTLGDSTEKGLVTGVVAASDNDGVSNHLDLDSDNDCRPDRDEPAFSTDPKLPYANPSDNCEPGTACDTSMGKCITACLADADCGGVNSGSICDPVSHLCVGGCRGAGGNACPAGDLCSSTTSAAGRCDRDTDGDGLYDQLEAELGTDPNQHDSDGDGIDDNVETDGGKQVDTDSDGTVDALDTDSDADGIPDSVEGGGDEDSDGKPNYRDLDSDGDAYPDAVETAVDTDGDSRPDYLDLDSDNDGVPDSRELALGSNRIVTDSDGDGIPDGVENPAGSERDTDGDGLHDLTDRDSDGDGLADATEKGANGSNPVDTDGDGLPDYRDLDSDSDGLSDADEKGTGPAPKDTNGDGVPDYQAVDSDGDGVADRDELGKDGKPVDTDGDGLNDELDTDSDNDCVADGIDSPGGRTDGALPSADPDDNCPSSAPRCARDMGRCVMPEGAVSVDDSTVLGSGFDCSATGGPSLLGLLGLALSLRRRRLRP